MTYDYTSEEEAAIEVDRSIPFIDVHHHIWDLQQFQYRWLEDSGRPELTALLGPYGMIRIDWPIERLLREFYGSNVVKSVHVEADFSGPDPVAETAWLETVATDWSFPHGLVVYCDLEQDDASDQLARHVAASSRTRGVRLRRHPDDVNAVPFEASARALVRHGLSYELNASPGRMRSGASMALAHPSLLVILGSAGFPLERTPEYFEFWKSEITSLAALENVACKISGLGMVDHAWTVESIRPWVLHCIESFGVDRCMFGTNWPVDILYSSYVRQVDAYRIILRDAGLTVEEQTSLLSRNAERFYRI
jgi:predicted TIM-barrel fold metal-dependent hydrolase